MMVSGEPINAALPTNEPPTAESRVICPAAGLHRRGDCTAAAAAAFEEGRNGSGGSGNETTAALSGGGGKAACDEAPLLGLDRKTTPTTGDDEKAAAAAAAASAGGDDEKEKENAGLALLHRWRGKGNGNCEMGPEKKAASPSPSPSPPSSSSASESHFCDGGDSSAAAAAALPVVSQEEDKTTMPPPSEAGELPSSSPAPRAAAEFHPPLQENEKMPVVVRPASIGNALPPVHRASDVPSCEESSPQDQDAPPQGPIEDETCGSSVEDNDEQRTRCPKGATPTPTPIAPAEGANSPQEAECEATPSSCLPNEIATVVPKLFSSAPVADGAKTPPQREEGGAADAGEERENSSSSLPTDLLHPLASAAPPPTQLRRSATNPVRRSSQTVRRRSRTVARLSGTSLAGSIGGGCGSPPAGGQGAGGAAGAGGRRSSSRRYSKPSVRLSETSYTGSVGSAAACDDIARRTSRILSVPPNLGRDELSLNKLRFSNLGLYGRDIEILRLREAYDDVRLRQRRERERRERERQKRLRERERLRKREAAAAAAESKRASSKKRVGMEKRASRSMRLVDIEAEAGGARPNKAKRRSGMVDSSSGGILEFEAEAAARPPKAKRSLTSCGARSGSARSSSDDGSDSDSEESVSSMSSSQSLGGSGRFSSSNKPSNKPSPREKGGAAAGAGSGGAPSGSSMGGGGAKKGGGGANNSGHPSLVLIGGRSGCGKSALANNIRGHVRRTGGLFSSGKFDFTRASEPYTAFARAFEGLCEDILSSVGGAGESDETARSKGEQREDDHRRRWTSDSKSSKSTAAFLKMRDAIRDAVGSELAVLNEVIPNLSRIVEHGEEGSASSITGNGNGNGGSFRRAHPKEKAGFSLGGFEGTKNRFQFAMRRFLRAVCSSGGAAAGAAGADAQSRPLVLFLDDLQWADAASLDLLRNLLSDRQNPNLLVLGSYRDNEVSSVDHPFNRWMQSVEGCCTTVDPAGEGGGPGGPGGADSSENGSVGTYTGNVTRIDLGNMDRDAVNELVADLLNSTLERTADLAGIVHRRTHGNGFAVVHFLKSLHEEGILYYCLGTLRWMWDGEEIRASTDVTDNVADLMTNKIRDHLGEDVQEVLRMASCLGSSFDSGVLSSIAGDVLVVRGGGEKEGAGGGGGEDDDDDDDDYDDANNNVKFAGAAGRRRVVRCLDSCVDEGLLEMDSSSSSMSSSSSSSSPSPSPSSVASAQHKRCRYRFAHDQIAAAAFDLIRPSDRESLQLRIGEALLKNLSETEVERDLFVVVGLLNRGLSLLHKHDDHIRRAAYAALNLRAGRKAMDASAFEPAAVYLRTGVDLLGDRRWDDHPGLTLDLLSTAAEAECVNANQEEMKRYVDEILDREDLPVKDKVRAYCTLMHSLYFLQDKALEAMDVGLLVLEELGVRFPRNHTKRATIVDLVKTKLLLRKLPVDAISSLPLMEDETRLLQMQIMNKVCDLAYFARPAFLPWLVFKMVRLTVKRGLCKYSSGAFACYGLMLVSIHGDIRRAHEFGKVSTALLRRFDAREQEARVLFICNGFISHWMVPAHVMHKRLLHGYEVGMQTGDTGFAMLSVRTYCLVGQFIGKPLSLIDTEMSTYTQQMRDHGQEKCMALLLPAWQLVLNLMGRSDDPAVLNGEAMRLETMLRHCDGNKDDILRNIIESHQIWAGFYFGDYEFCGRLVQGTKGKTKRATVITWRRALFDGLTAFELARRGRSPRESREWKAHASKVAAKVRGWAERGNVNCTHVQFLFEAERAALEGKHAEAREKYERAISTVSRHGFLNDRALANERAGEYFVERGDRYFAAHHLGLAHQLYSNWGAVAKAAHLYKKHKGLFDEDSGIPVGMDIERRWSD